MNRIIAALSFSLLIATLAFAGLLPQNPPPKVSLAWDKSTEITVNQYRVYYGVASRDYTNYVSVGNTNFCTISNLLRGVTYYFAATALNTDGLESDFSNEVFYKVPTVPGAPTIRLALSIESWPFPGYLLTGTGDPNSGCLLEASYGTLTKWRPLGIFTTNANGVFTFLDQTTESTGFYRATSI